MTLFAAACGVLGAQPAQRDAAPPAGYPFGAADRQGLILPIRQQLRAAGHCAAPDGGHARDPMGPGSQRDSRRWCASLGITSFRNLPRARQIAGHYAVVK